MNKFDIDTLKRGRQSIIANIIAIEEALLKERGLLAQYDQEIENAESILRAHGVTCAEEMHDWDIIATFEDGRWKRRQCKKCSTKQKLGNA